LDIGVLGYIGIVQHKEHSPEVLSIPPGTLRIYFCPDERCHFSINFRIKSYNHRLYESTVSAFPRSASCIFALGY